MLPMWSKVAIAGSALLIGVGLKYFWPSYPDDNIFEEKLEEIIKDKTGMGVDFTPFSRETTYPTTKL